MTQPAEPDIHKMNQKLIALEREVEDLKKKVKQLESKVGTAGGRDG
jgi:predicted  nucleic acid-binding Zn-ribbon protein